MSSRHSRRLQQDFLRIEKNLGTELMKLHYGARVHAYNPLDYAAVPHQEYISKYLSKKKVLFLGMNPGKYGMAQNGIPFGDTDYVKGFLGIRKADAVRCPDRIKRFKGRREVSGKRLWGFIEEECETAEQFFHNCFVHNYCPLLFLNERLANVTLANPPPGEWENLEAACDKALLECIEMIDAKIIVGIGNYAFERAELAADTINDERRRDGMDGPYISVEKIRHPSPAGRLSAKKWEEIVIEQLQESDIMKYLTPPLSSMQEM